MAKTAIIKRKDNGIASEREARKSSLCVGWYPVPLLINLSKTVFVYKEGVWRPLSKD